MATPTAETTTTTTSPACGCDYPDIIKTVVLERGEVPSPEKLANLKPDDVFSYFARVAAAVTEDKTIATENVNGIQLTFEVMPTVHAANYRVKELTDATWEVLNKHLESRAVYRERMVHLLDVGTGTGYIGIVLGVKANQAGFAADATLTDVNPEAVKCAMFNYLANRCELEKVTPALIRDIRVADVYTGIDDIGADVADGFVAAGDMHQMFDFIIWNTPWVHDERFERTPDMISTLDPRGALLERFVREADNWLVPGGLLVFSVSNCCNQQLLRQFADAGWEMRCFRHSHPFEGHPVLRYDIVATKRN